MNGIITYEIGKDGCLNGFYSNESAKGIYNEIARKEPQQNNEDDDLCGKYKSAYFQGNNDIVIADLVITKQSGVYHLEWTSKKGNFTGTGFKTRDNELVVRYNSK
jgi:hypothetical protein